MSWKQPIPTDIQYDDRFTALDRAIFREVLTLCQRQDTVVQFRQAGKSYAVDLKRGQCIFKVAEFAAQLNHTRQKIRGSLSILSKWYSEMDIKGMPYGCIITVKNYDELTKMDNETNMQRTFKEQSKNNESTAKENVERVENVKNNIYIGEVVSRYTDKINSQSKLTDKARDKISTRLKTYSKEDLFRAIDNFSNDSWWMQNNAHRGIAWFFHSDDRIEQFLLFETKKKRRVVDITK